MLIPDRESGGTGMKLCHYREVEPIEDAPGILRRVVVGPDDGAPTFVMRVFEISPGSSTPFHSHSWEHEMFVLSGRGIAKSKEGDRPVGEGTVAYVAPHEEHCFTNTGDELLRVVCLIPRLES
jgi:quercetin dioxygenase-like cupin family protein